MVLTVPLKLFGSKSRICKWIHKIAEPIRGTYINRVYVFGGAMGESINWEHEGISEVYNDIDFRLTNFFAVLQDKVMFEEFVRKVEEVPFSQSEWNEAHFINQIEPPVEWKLKPDKKIMMALAFFVDCRQSLSGQMKSFAPLSKTRIRRGMNEQASAWLTAVEGLRDVHHRLIRMAIRNEEWDKLIDQEDSPLTLGYYDPPYLPETRVAKTVYKHEFAYEDHERLLKKLETIKGRFMLSGYHSEMYDEWAKHGCYNVYELETDCKSGHGKTKSRRIECVYTNF